MARALDALPLISGAMARGEVSYSRVRPLTRIATARNEDDLLMIALHGTANHAVAAPCDALVAFAESWMAHGPRALAGGDRQQIVIHVDNRSTASGRGVSAETLSSRYRPSVRGP